MEGLHPLNVANIINTRIISEDSNSLEWILNDGNNHIACLPMACIELLRRIGVTLAGEDVVIIGRSNRVSLPLSLLLTHCNATVTTVHSSTRNIYEIIKRSTIVITSIGKPNTIQASWLKPGAVVIDLGTTPTITDKGLLLLGDCDYEACKEVASYITPPGQAGGLGSLSFAMMLKNILIASKSTSDIDLVPITSQKIINPRRLPIFIIIRHQNNETTNSKKTTASCSTVDPNPETIKIISQNHVQHTIQDENMSRESHLDDNSQYLKFMNKVDFSNQISREKEKEMIRQKSIVLAQEDLGKYFFF